MKHTADYHWGFARGLTWGSVIVGVVTAAGCVALDLWMQGWVWRIVRHLGWL